MGGPDDEFDLTLALEDDEAVADEFDLTAAIEANNAANAPDQSNDPEIGW